MTGQPDPSASGPDDSREHPRAGAQPGGASGRGASGRGGLVMAEPVWVPMTEEEHHRAVEALGALLAWAAAHPDQWQGRKRSPD